jgi:hypothetical protein
MGAPTVDVRCPTCGGDLHVVLAPAPPTQWFPCPHCRAPVPVVVPRDPPPLYSWEVLPGLYPALPAPRIPRRRGPSAVTAALLTIAVLAAVCAGVLVYDAWDVVQPASFGVAGIVESGASGFAQPVAGATVRMTNDANQTSTEVTGPGGTFSFSHVPAGGVTLNVSAPGFSTRSVLTFVSSVYAGPTSGIVIDLTPGAASNVTSVALAEFPDLEQFVAALGSGAVLLAVVTLVAGAAAVLASRRDRPALAVIGGGAGLVSPFVLLYLSLTPLTPLLTGATIALASLGVFVVTTRAIQIAQTGPAAD